MLKGLLKIPLYCFSISGLTAAVGRFCVKRRTFLSEHRLLRLIYSAAGAREESQIASALHRKNQIPQMRMTFHTWPTPRCS